jgi:hypothetical protein
MKTNYHYNELPVNWKIYCYQRAKKIGYKGKEIKLLIFEIRGGELTGIIDRFILADTFSNKKKLNNENYLLPIN